MITIIINKCKIHKKGSFNLATLFAPNLMDSFNDNLSQGNLPMSLNSNRMDHVSALKSLVKRQDLAFWPEV